MLQIFGSNILDLTSDVRTETWTCSVLFDSFRLLTRSAFWDTLPSRVQTRLRRINRLQDEEEAVRAGLEADFEPGLTPAPARTSAHVEKRRPR